MPEPLDLDHVRRQFPSLAGEWVFLDNAGGSQTLGTVAERARDYLLRSNVQLGASYEPSRIAGERVAAGQAALAELVGAADPGEVISGPSTTVLLRMLADSIGRTLRPGDEIIVTDCDHEANIGPWLGLERLGATVRVWRTRRESASLETADLEALLSPRTRLVAVTHVSNVLGTIHPLAAWADLAHAHGAWICADGVAFAPHARVDVRALGVDFYALSLYKIYGPHQAVLYGKRERLLELPGANHFFVPDDALPAKFQPGNPNYELSWASTAILDYLRSLGGDLEDAFRRIQAHERTIGGRLLDYLATKPRVRVVGSPTMGEHRVPTVSFVVDGVASSALPPQVDPHKIGIRWGDFYARRLIERLGLADLDGVVRVSMVHYNTEEEVDRLIEALEPLID